MTDDSAAGFKELTRLAAARETLLGAVTPLSATESVPLDAADERALAREVVAPRPVPHYERAAMDGYAVRAEDTFEAGERSPVELTVGERVGPGQATYVNTGAELPAGADAVVVVEATERRGDEIEVFEAVAEGANVAPVGEDVAEGQHLFDPGHRLRPSDLGLLKAAGKVTVEVYERPTVAVVPTGDELVRTDPDPGEVIETNGQAVSQYVRRWGGNPSYRKAVSDDRQSLRVALQRDMDHDVIVTTGGSSVGERDLLPSVVDDLGEVLVHGVALAPGHPVAVGVVEETPVVALPGYPVATIVTAVQLLRPAMKRAGHLPVEHPPTTEARLARKIPSEPGTRTFARVELEKSGTDTAPEATPTRASGAGVLSSVALADGWVVVPEDREGYAAGDVVTVEHWEWSP